VAGQVHDPPLCLVVLDHAWEIEDKSSVPD
jgi:hypothetical protein